MKQNSEKIQDTHLRRRAVIYVRSSVLSSPPVPAGVTVPRESLVLLNRARALGWEDKDISLIDQDSGQPGLATKDRRGYMALAAAVRAGDVGAVFVMDSSRLTRCSAELNSLAQTCSKANTLIITEDAIFDPANEQDRLFLLLKDSVVHISDKH